MEQNERRSFLRKAAISLAALGALGGNLPAFGAPFILGASPVADDDLAITTVVTRTTRKTFTYSQIETITVPDKDTLVQLKRDESSGSYLNLGA